MHNRNIVPALAVQFSMGAISCTLYYMLVLHTQQQPGLCFPQIWMVYGPLIYGINRWFLGRERTALALFLLNFFLCATLYLSIFAEKGWNGFLGAGCIIFICGMLTIRGAQLAMNPPSLGQVMTYLDVGAVVLVIFFIYLMAVGLPLVWSVPIVLSFAVTIVGVISVRIDRPMGPKEWGVLTIAFIAIALMVWVFVTVAAAPAGQGLVALWNALLAVGAFLLRVMWAILVFIASLFGEPVNGELEPPAEIRIPAMEEVSGEGNPVILMIFAAAAVVILLYFAVLGLRLLARLRVGGRKSVARKKPQGNRTSFLEALKRFLAGIRKQFYLRLYLYRNRNDPVGLFYHLVRRCRRSPWHKRTGETPGMFLRRMKDSAVDDGELVAALEELIPVVDAALYGPGDVLRPFPQAALIRGRIRRSVRRHYVSVCFDNLRSVMKRLSEREKASQT